MLGPRRLSMFNIKASAGYSV